MLAWKYAHENQRILLQLYAQWFSREIFPMLSMVFHGFPMLSVPGEGQTEMLKQIEVKVSVRKKSGMHQPIGLRKDGFTARNINLQNLLYCQCLKLRSNYPTLFTNIIFNYSPIMQEQSGCG